MFQSDFSLVAVVKDAITASGIADAVISCKTVSRSGTARIPRRVPLVMSPVMQATRLRIVLI